MSFEMGLGSRKCWLRANRRASRGHVTSATLESPSDFERLAVSG
jgi:hypothetical protein